MRPTDGMSARMCQTNMVWHIRDRWSNASESMDWSLHMFDGRRTARCLLFNFDEGV